MRVAFFTAGTAGAGHAVRGTAIRRALARAGFAGEYRIFAPEAARPFLERAAAPWDAIEIREADLRDPETAKASSLARALASFRPELLLVDMFWAPLRFVLPLVGCEAWLLLRSFPPTWLDGPPGVPFAPVQYARIIAIEPVTSPHLTHAIDPVVLVNPDEKRPRGALRDRLGVPDGKRLVAVAHAGAPGEIAALARAGGANEVVATFDLRADDALFPLAEWLDDVDELHAAAGYNTFWESRWLGWHARTRFTALPRRNDDPRWRMTACAAHPMKANGADTLASWIV